MTQNAPLSLMTFPPMINSEACRFVLDHYGVAYKQEAHVYGKGVSMAGPYAMAEHFEKTVPPEKRLFPANRMERIQMDADWSRYNWGLGIATAVIGYFHLLPLKPLMFEPLTRGVPKWEASYVKNFYGSFKRQFNLLDLSPKHAADALEETRILFEETDRRIADGRRFLVGDTLTLADIALATACGPVLLPEGNGAPIPPFVEMPEALRAVINELRQSKTAGFVARIYREHAKG
jgi:glutathione S-transferase